MSGFRQAGAAVAQSLIEKGAANVPIVGQVMGVVSLFAKHGTGIHQVTRNLTEYGGWEPIGSALFVALYQRGRSDIDQVAAELKAIGAQVAPRGYMAKRTRPREDGDLAEAWMNVLAHTDMDNARVALWYVIKDQLRRSGQRAKGNARARQDIQIQKFATADVVRKVRAHLGVI